MGKLRDCPFCGGGAERVEIDEPGDNFGGTCIACKRCGACGPVHFGFKENLEPSWNERVPLPSIVACDVLEERERQECEEGWTPEHNDMHARGEMAFAAACYASCAHDDAPWDAPTEWPWSAKWWKPTDPRDPRRDLVKAAALIIAEIERIDRASEQDGSS